MEPPNQGYALPAMVAPLSPAAAKVREIEISHNPSSHEIKLKTRFVPDQLQLPCCISTALSAGMEALDGGWPRLSPLFHYHVTRYEWGGANANGFLILTKGLEVLDAKGICSHELHHPDYTEAGGISPPSSSAYKDALTRTPSPLQSRYVHFSGTSRVVWMRNELKHDRPVIIGFLLPMGYPASITPPDFLWRDAGDPPLSNSGHCVVALGYDDSLRAFCVQDSKGDGMFDKGCWWMGYNIVDSPAVQEIYSLQS